MPTKPNPNQYPEFYKRYTDIVPEGDIFEILLKNKNDIAKLLYSMSAEDANYRYAEGKWSIKELLGHIIDTERIFAYRALRMARNDKTNIPQYDHDAYVAVAEFDSQNIKDLIEQYKLIRDSSILLFKSFNNEAWERTGFSGDKEFIAKCFPYIMAGHELHHVSIIKERYLTGLNK